MLFSVSLDDDSVPNTQVNEPPLLSITPPDEQPGSAVVGTPEPLYAWNMSAQPLVPDKDVFHAVLFGIVTQQPEQEPE